MGSEPVNGFERRKEQKKESIRRAALELFKLYGTKKVSISEIAEKAGVSQVTIYNHFGSKEELVRDTVKKMLLSLMERYQVMMESEQPFLKSTSVCLISLEKERNRATSTGNSPRKPY